MNGYHVALNTFGRCQDNPRANCLILLFDEEWNIKKTIAPMLDVEPEYYLASFQSAFDGRFFYLINSNGFNISKYDFEGKRLKIFDLRKLYENLHPLDVSTIDRNDPYKSMEILRTSPLTSITYFTAVNGELLIQLTNQNLEQTDSEGTRPLVFFSADGELIRILIRNDNRLLKADSTGFYFLENENVNGEIFQKVVRYKPQ